MNPGRACVESHHKNTHLGPFQDHPHTPKGVALKSHKPMIQVSMVNKRGKYALLN